ncbi:GTP-binding protein [Cellulomonas sp.]|uniref:GTP-binding protein n=1 Tax=Cellulomonas sp. TaxID=40001 RepID=UPI002D54688B|nr:GTP-binding protein [Cellulomonas sp.]HYQ73608.1 GTP-binding protein [Cellulomonas sp.]
MIWSLTEGEDKPLKYPVMFRAADAVVVNKTDLAPHLDVDLARFRRHLADVNPDATVLELSARTGEGVGAWLAWLRAPLGPPLGTARP